MYFDQLFLAARQVNVVYSDQLLGAAYYIHFISYHDNRYDYTLPFFTNELGPEFQNKLESFFAENFSDLFMSWLFWLIDWLNLQIYKNNKPGPVLNINIKSPRDK